MMTLPKLSIMLWGALVGMLFFSACGNTSKDRQRSVDSVLHFETNYPVDTAVLKYYYFGIARADPNWTASMLAQHGVRIINRIEVLNKEEIERNRITDSLIFKRIGKSVRDFYLLPE